MPYGCERQAACALRPLPPACTAPLRVPGATEEFLHRLEIAYADPRGLLCIPYNAGKHAVFGRLKVPVVCAPAIARGAPYQATGSLLLPRDILSVRPSKE